MEAADHSGGHPGEHTGCALDSMAASAPIGAMPTFHEVLLVWLRIGLLSFGGPAGQIALLHREVVEQRRWIGERRFLHALNFCTLLPQENCI